jgi:hypothetical protein
MATSAYTRAITHPVLASGLLAAAGVAMATAYLTTQRGDDEG